MTRAIERVMVVTAHPDDPEFGAGGTIATLVKDGLEVTYVIVTNGRCSASSAWEFLGYEDGEGAVREGCLRVRRGDIRERYGTTSVLRVRIRRSPASFPHRRRGRRRPRPSPPGADGRPGPCR